MNHIKESEDDRLAEPRVDEQGDVRAEVTLHLGQMRGIVLETGTAGPISQVRVAEAWRPLEESVDFWRNLVGSVDPPR